MPAKTPVRIAEKVLKLWLFGLTRDEISKRTGTSVGNILNIVNEAKKNIPDLVLLRKVAVWINKQGWKQDAFSSAVRHRNMLYKRGLKDDQIDRLIEVVDEHCFQREMAVDYFIASLENLSIVSEKHGCTIDGLDELIREKESLVDKLQIKVKSLESVYNEMLERNGVTETELIQYRQDLPLLDTIKKLRTEIDEWHVSRVGIQLEMAGIFSRAIAKEGPSGMDLDEVNKAVRLLTDNAPYLKEEIKSILSKESSLPNAYVPL